MLVLGLGLVFVLGLGLVFVLGLVLDYGLGFSSDIRLRQDPQLGVSHLATTLQKGMNDAYKAVVACVQPAIHP